MLLVAGSLRLARFNISTAKTDHRYFVGLPIPAGALTIAAIINYAPTPVADRRFAAMMLVVTALLAFAMVSTVRYRSQKYASLQKERSFTYVILLAVFLVVLLRWPDEFLFVLAISYVVSGPMVRLWSIAFPSRKLPEEPEPSADSPIIKPT